MGELFAALQVQNTDIGRERTPPMSEENYSRYQTNKKLWHSQLSSYYGTLPDVGIILIGFISAFVLGAPPKRRRDKGRSYNNTPMRSLENRGFDTLQPAGSQEKQLFCSAKI